ncbi:MAG: integration host factor subunit beta [Microscillaceae bacterium]|nr:integration host factor subunit beta [Microscillaceae bacterium]MDW8461365.1 HU family DNA-binding protein [Cytophagales bacterium]
MTKAEVIAEIAEKMSLNKGTENLTKEHISAVLEAFFKVVQKSMEEGENIYIRGFGSFVNKKRAKKIARNIAANTPIEIPAHFIPSFKPSKNFVDKIKNSKKLKEILVKIENGELKNWKANTQKAED